MQLTVDGKHSEGDIYYKKKKAIETKLSKATYIWNSQKTDFVPKLSQTHPTLLYFNKILSFAADVVWLRYVFHRESNTLPGA